MKSIVLFLTIVFLQTSFLFASNVNDTLLKQKQCFYDAKTELESMLTGKTPLDYERAIFLTENAYRNNETDYGLFKRIIDFHTNNIKKLAEANRNEKAQDFKQNFLEVITEEQKKERYTKLLYNWAIYTYIKDTTFVIDSNFLYFHLPYIYSFEDPFGTNNWENTQVFSLLNNKRANCFALASLFKIFAERLNTEANLGIAPGHIYINHDDANGINYNIELASRSFPGAGTIMTLTYSPTEAVRNGIAMRTLDLKQSVALCLVYLAKGYEHRFKTKTDNFIYQRAETALQFDSLNLNAMLLKAEVLEKKIIDKNKSIAQLQKDYQFNEYEKLIADLYIKGYREMPLDMKNIIINKLQKDSLSLILTDHTPNGFQSIHPKDDRYATLSWGLFDEIHQTKTFEQYNNTLFNTKSQKITKFVASDTLYNKYQMDAAVFAWQVDPLTAKYPNMSPYVAFANNPIIFVDNDGKEVKPMSKEAYQIIIYGLSPEEAKYIKLDANGNIDKTFMQQGTRELNSVGDNFSSLLSLVNDKQIIEVSTQNYIETDKGVTEMKQPRYESELDGMYEFDNSAKGKTKEEYAKSNPSYSTNKDWSGWFGATLYPDEDAGYGKTKNGNIQVIINSNTVNADKSGIKKMTSIFAHEAYGHVLYKLLGLQHSHGKIKSLSSESPENNKALENQIYNRENEAEKNYDIQNQ